VFFQVSFFIFECLKLKIPSMKKIAAIIAEYDNKLNDIKKLELDEFHKFKKNINSTKECLNELRIYIRAFKFPSDEEEINFFKYQKPLIYGNLKYFTHIQKYHLEKPKSNVIKHKKLVQGYLDKLEAIKKKHINFFKYYEQNLTSLDQVYFLRGDSQYEMNFDTLHLDREPEFSTSHDFLAARIRSNNLLSKYYSKELNKIQQKESKKKIKEVKPEILKDLSWTGSKTDLTELLFALNAAGAIKNGNSQIKKLEEISKELFDIDLGNMHKTFEQIKARKKDHTKFLDKLKHSLSQVINS